MNPTEYAIVRTKVLDAILYGDKRNHVTWRDWTISITKPSSFMRF